MRRKLAMAVSVGGMLVGSPVMGQFAVDARTPAQPPTTPAPFGGAQPPAAPGYSPAPVGGFSPAPSAGPGFTPAPAQGPGPMPVIEIPRAVPANHPWALTAETGPYFICVKSYSRPAKPDPNDPGMTALQMSELLANEVRNTYKVGAFLFEYISEEKRAEAESRAKALQQAQAFSAALATRREASKLNGMEFLGGDQKIYYKTFRYRDQIAVLIGPWQTEKDAATALAIVKTWPAPKDNRLMDGGAIVQPGPNGQAIIERSYINPYQQAMVVANPAIERAPAPAPSTALDPFVVKLNEGRPYSLLTATRGWTLAVKSFSAPVQISSKDDDFSMNRLKGTSKSSDVLAAGAEQAEKLAEALRAMKDDRGRSLGLEAYVLHTRTSSVVTVGQFDGPNDPALLEKRRLLLGMKLGVSKDANGQVPVDKPELFPHVLPIPIPRP